MATSPRHCAFYGPDGFSAREAVRSLRADLEVADNNVVRLDGRTATLNEVAAATQTASFFAEARLVIIEGLAARFSGRRRRGARPSRRAGGAGEDQASELDRLIELLATAPDGTTVVLLDDDKVSAGVLDAYKTVTKVTFFPIMRAPELRRWAEARAKAQGAAISGSAIDRLCQIVDGHHIGELAQEIDKLAAYADGRRIEVRDIEEVGSGAIQLQTWDLTDAVVAGRADKALTVLQRIDEKAHPAQVLLSMIVRQYRQVFLAQALLKEGFSAAQIGERLGITHSFPLGKVIDQASRYPADRLERAYRRLLEADAAVKTGILDIDTALELLIVDLTEIANAGRRGSQPVAARR